MEACLTLLRQGGGSVNGPLGVSFVSKMGMGEERERDGDYLLGLLLYGSSRLT